MKHIHARIKKLSRREILLITLLVGVIVFVVVRDYVDNTRRDRDSARIQSVLAVRNALEDFKDKKGYFPPCLYIKEGCESLEGSDVMPTVPRDPLTQEGFAYAAFGKTAKCDTYHIGISLERRVSQILITGADAPPREDKELCKGSAPDFSGLSYVPGGEQCDRDPGVPQPTYDPDGESCYDLTQRRR